MTDRPKQIGTPADVACQPLVHALRRRALFLVEPGTAAENTLRFRSRALDFSFISPIEYAREGADYAVLPGAGLSSIGAADTVTLHFREGVRDIRTVAVDPASTAEVVLAMIILQESFDVRPAVVPVMGGLDPMLGKADAALLVGNASLRETARHPNRLDLVDHWIDLTGLPYCHGFWCAREDTATAEELSAFRECAEEASAAAPGYTPAMLDAGLPPLSAERLSALLSTVAFGFGGQEEEAVDEFLRYAFYHGMLPDVPEIRLATPPADDPSPLH